MTGGNHKRKVKGSTGISSFNFMFFFCFTIFKREKNRLAYVWFFVDVGRGRYFSWQNIRNKIKVQQ